MNHDLAGSGYRIQKKGCCMPSPHARTGQIKALGGVASDEFRAARREGMVELAGGTFLMGTDYAEGFPADGEGPVRSVTLYPFAMDRYPVTNNQFEEFVRKTGT